VFPLLGGDGLPLRLLRGQVRSPLAKCSAYLPRTGIKVVHWPALRSALRCPRIGSPVSTGPVSASLGPGAVQENAHATETYTMTLLGREVYRAVRGILSAGAALGPRRSRSSEELRPPIRRARLGWTARVQSTRSAYSRIACGKVGSLRCAIASATDATRCGMLRRRRVDTVQGCGRAANLARAERALDHEGLLRDPLLMGTVDFFLSYAHTDRAWAEWMAWQLDSHGYTTRYQARDFRPGMNFIEEMNRAISEADRTLIIVSPAFAESVFGRAEWSSVLAQGRPGKLLPIVVAACELPPILTPLIHINLVGMSREEAQKALLDGVVSELSPRSREPAFPGDAPVGGVVPPPFPGRESPKVDRSSHERREATTLERGEGEGFRASLPATVASVRAGPGLAQPKKTPRKQIGVAIAGSLVLAVGGALFAPAVTGLLSSPSERESQASAAATRRSADLPQVVPPVQVEPSVARTSASVIVRCDPPPPAGARILNGADSMAIEDFCATENQSMATRRSVFAALHFDQHRLETLRLDSPNPSYELTIVEEPGQVVLHVRKSHRAKSTTVRSAKEASEPLVRKVEVAPATPSPEPLFQTTTPPNEPPQREPPPKESVSAPHTRIPFRD
jgi:hypothetical protein